MAKYDLNAAFRGWPIPGAQFGGQIRRVCYPYNPRFVNGGAPPYYGPSKRGFLLNGGSGFDMSTGVFPNPPFSQSDFCDGAIEDDEWYDITAVIVGQPIGIGGTLYSAQITYPDGPKSDQDNWLSGIAGSVRGPRLLSGKTYWEVKIVTLPSDVPPVFTKSYSYSVPPPSIGSPQDGPPDPTLFNGGHITANSLPGEYVYSATAMPNPPSWAGGFSDDGSKWIIPYSGSLPTNSPTGPPATYQDSGVPANSLPGVIIADLPYGAIGYYDFAPSHTQWYNHVSAATPPAPSETDIDTDVNFVHEAQSGGTITINRGVSFPPSLNTFFNPTIGLVPSDPTFTQYDLIGLDSPSSKTRSIGVTRTSVMMGQENNQGNLVNKLYGDHWFLSPDLTSGDIPAESYTSQSGPAGVCLPFTRALPGLHETLYAAPVFKGRGDSLVSIKTPGTDSGNGGVWTGVDLGTLAINDVIMMATDCASRKVWFGKNGTWIGPSGDGADPVGGGGAACLMDGSPGTQNYYPGASYRYGPTHLRFAFRRDQFTYAPPSGFLPYDFWLNNPNYAPSLATP